MSVFLVVVGEKPKTKKKSINKIENSVFVLLFFFHFHLIQRIFYFIFIFFLFLIKFSKKVLKIYQSGKHNNSIDIIVISNNNRKKKEEKEKQISSLFCCCYFFGKYFVNLIGKNFHLVFFYLFS